jgi:hypothetical protein
LIITSLLQRPTTAEQRQIGLKIYTYHPGFQDLVAILLYNLESPTLTSMVINQLATHHWTTLLSSKSKLQGYLAATFMPLLDHFDGRLARHLQDQGFVQPTFCRSWLATWFASDVGEAAAASRLLDVLLVTHPLMIVYLCVAWVIHYRQRLVKLNNFVELAKTLRGLPLEATTTTTTTATTMTSPSSHQDKDIAISTPCTPNLEIVEDVIAKALQMIQDLSPSALVTLVRNLQPDSNDTVLLTNATCLPTWLIASYGPTDWALVSSNKSWDTNKEEETTTTTITGNPKIDLREYPLACQAVGDPSLVASSLSSSCRRIKSYHWLLLLFFVVVTGMVGGGGTFSYWNHPATMVSLTPSGGTLLTRHSVKGTLLLGRTPIDYSSGGTTNSAAAVSSKNNQYRYAAVSMNTCVHYILRLPRIWYRWWTRQRDFWTRVWTEEEKWYMFW